MATRPTTTTSELEAAIEADPADRMAYEVLADVLQREGDPRGELIALQLAEPTPELEARARTIIDTHTLEPLLLEGCLWHWGFIDATDLPPAPRDVLRAALDHGSMRFVSEVWLPADEAGFQDRADALASRSRPTLTALYFGVRAVGPGPGNPSAGDLGALDQLWPQLPNLRSLWLTGQNVELGSFALPRLTHLVLDSIALRGYVIDAILDQTWDELQLLDLGFGVATPANAWELLGHPFPKLRSLRVAGGLLDDLVEALVGSRLLPHLSRLALTSGLTDRGAAILLRHPDAFAHLERLDLRRNYLTPATTTALAAIGKDVRLTDQRAPSERDPELYDY